MTFLSLTEATTLACAPLLMLLVSAFEHRWGPRVAGIMAAAPLTALIGLLLVRADLGTAASHEMAMRMSGYVPAQVGIAMVVVALVGRTGFWSALALGTLTFGLLATMTVPLPMGVALALSLAVLLVSQRVVPAPTTSIGDGAELQAGATGWRMVALRAAVSLATAFVLLVVARHFGTAASGAVGAYPIFTATLCAFIFTASGAVGVRQVLAGMVQGLPAYFAFVVVFALTGPRFGVVGSTLAGAAACVVYYGLVSTRAAAPRTTANQPPDDEMARSSRARSGAAAS